MRNWRKECVCVWRGGVNQVSGAVLKNHNAADLYITFCKAAAHVAVVSFYFVFLDEA